MSEGRYILDDDGRPVPCPDIHAWAKWFDRMENRRVALHVGDACTISTVFLAMDHDFSGVGPPILYETLITYTLSQDDRMERHTTREKAMERHAWHVRNEGLDILATHKEPPDGANEQRNP